MEKEMIEDVYERRYLKVTYDIDEIAARYKKLYTALIYDTLNKEFGLSSQALSPGIYPLRDDMKIAGPAFTLLRKDSDSTDPYYHNMRLGLINSMSDGCILVSDGGDNLNCGQFGEITATAMRAHGCAGALIDGSTRDSNYLVNMNFPTFVRFRSPVESLGRSLIVDYQIPVTLKGIDGNLKVEPGDYVFGDMDGVIIIPKGLTIPVLEVAEEAFEAEKVIREAMAEGRDPIEVYNSYGHF